MKKLLLILLCFIFFLNSCVRKECENCTKLFDTQFSNAELDIIVQVLVNDSLEYNYQDWNEFITFNFPDLNTRSPDLIALKRKQSKSERTLPEHF